MNKIEEYVPNGFSADIFRDRYAITEKETFAEACQRVSLTVVQAEFEKNKQKYCERFYDLLLTNRFCPGGRIWNGSGKTKGNLLNCFVIGAEDSREGWGELLKNNLIISGVGGGVGCSFSKIRPRGTEIKGTGGQATGAISLMRMINSVCEELRTGGNRRSANMFCLDYNHGDIEEFLSAKLDKKELTNANISICIDNKFIELIKDDKDINLSWQGKTIGTLKARKLWNCLVENALRQGDPGLLNLGFANQQNPISYITDLTSTNPCFTGDMYLHTDKGIFTLLDLYEQQKQFNVIIDNRIIDNSHVNMKNKGIYISDNTPVKLTAKKQQVYAMTTKHGHLMRCTSYHEFPTPEGRKQLKDLEIGDTILLQSQEGKWGNIGSYEDGLIIGHITGDGSILYRKGKEKYEAVLSFFNEDVFANKLLDIVNNKTQIYNKEISNKRDKNDRWRNRKFKISLLGTQTQEKRISSILLFDYLNKTFNLNRDTKKRIPKCIMQGNRDMVRGYLASFFQADGSVYYTNDKSSIAIQLSQSNLNILRDVQILLNNFGIVSRIYKNRDAGQKLLPDGHGGKKLYNIKTQYTLTINKPNSIVFEQKINFEGKKRHKLRDLLNKTGRDCLRPERFISKVIKIEKDNIEDVYCLTEFKTNSIIVNGCITGNCGEIWLSPNDCCCLGSIVLNRHIIDDKLDWNLLAETITLGVRFLDNILDVTQYPLPEIEKTCKQHRRIGLGITGLHDMLILLGIKYSSKEALEFTDKLMSFLKKKAYEANTYLSIERGQFPLMDREKHLKTGFIKTLSPSIKHRIREYGLRNCCILTIAPGGTTSILSNCSSGIEPMFAPVYERSYNEHKDSNSGMKNKSKRIVIHPLLKEFIEQERDVSVFEGAHEISPEQHIAMQQVCQKHIDNSVSKTINIPNTGFNKSKLSKLLLDNMHTLKGVTVYRDGSKGVSPLMPIPVEKAQKYFDQIEKVETKNVINDCPKGQCDL